MGRGRGREGSDPVLWMIIFTISCPGRGSVYLIQCAGGREGGGEDVAGGCLCCEGMITGGAMDQAGSSWGTNDRTYQA